MSTSVIVVGAGVIGSSLAYELTNRGASVTVIDAAESASGTSAATYGWVNSNGKSPDEYGHLNLLGLRAHERALHSPKQGTWFHQIGTVELAQSAAEAEQLEQKVDRLVHNTYDAAMLSAAQVRDLEPSLRSEPVVAGALYAQEGWIDAPTMCFSLLHRATGMGATFIPYHRVTEITADGVEASGPGGASTRYSADVVVMAAGNGARALLASMGFDLPLLAPTSLDEAGDTYHPTVGLISTTSPIDSRVRHMIRAEGIALRPARNGGITFTDHPTGGQWDRADPRIWTIPDELLDRARRLYPTLDRASTETVTIGTRVLPEDGLTIADWIESDAPLYTIATHSGVTLAAHLAEAVAEEILTGTRHESLKPFGLSRFVN